MSLLPAGWLSVQGNQFVDAATGTPVRIASVGWNQAFNTIQASVALMASGGFNCTRVSWVNATMQQDMPRIDQVVAAAKANGLKVIIDHHTCENGTAADGWGSQQKNGLPYDLGGASNGTNGAGVKGTVTLQKFISDWVIVAKRYAGNSTVVGYDLTNEPLRYPGMSTWGDGNPNTDLTLIYKAAGDAIHAVEPNVLIICEGPQFYGTNLAGNGQAPWGDLSIVRTHPVILDRPNKLAYSVHDYPKYVAGFSPDSGQSKVTLMNNCWGYLVKEGIAPVWVGEMGANFDGSYAGENVTASQAWAQTLLDYMNGKLGSQGGPTFSGNQQPISGNWWAWGCLDGQQLCGVLDNRGNFRAAQKSAWMQLLPAAVFTQPTPSPIPVPTQPSRSASPDKTVVLAGSNAQIIDGHNNTWAINASGQIVVNGNVDTSTANVVEIAYVNGQVWQQNGNKLWWAKTAPSDSWSPTNGTGTNPLTGVSSQPVPTPTSAGSGSWIHKSVGGMDYMVLLPHNYVSSTKYPLVLYLHQLDMGTDVPDLQKQVDGWFNTSTFRSQYSVIVVMPLLDQRSDPSGQTINFGGVGSDDNRGLLQAIGVLKQSITDYPTDVNRIFVTGNSLGGIGTWDILIKYNAYTGTHEHIFAAGMPLAGANFGQGYPVPNPPVVDGLKNVPIWAIHGGQDNQVPLAWDRAIYAAIKALGGRMHYTEDPNLGHDVWDTYYPQTGPSSPLGWLLAQSSSPVQITPQPVPIPTPVPVPVPPAPVPTPVVPTPMPLPPTQATSPNNTVIAAGAKAIVDLNGHVWGLSHGQVVVDGAVDHSTSNVNLLAFVNGSVWQENKDNLWWHKTLPTDTWLPTKGTSVSPLPTNTKPTITISSLRTGRSTMISGTNSSVAHPDGTIIEIAGEGQGFIRIGSADIKLVCSQMLSVDIVGGSGTCVIVSDAGTNSYVAGSGTMIVTGGPGSEIYQYGPGNGLLTIENFSSSKRDQLVISSKLKPHLISSPETDTGTHLTFENFAVGIDIKRIPPVPLITIKWA